MADEKSINENNANRMSKNEYYLLIALAVSKRSTCLKRRYGAVIVNNDEIVSTGYNGNPRGEENCCDRGNCQDDAEPCPICFRMIKNSGIDRIVSKKGVLNLRDLPECQEC